MSEYLKKILEYKNIYTIFVVAFIATVIIVIFCWPKDDVKDFAKYKELNLDQKYREIGNEYMSKLMFYIRYNNAEEIISKLSNDYLSYIGKTQTEVKDEIFSRKVMGLKNLDVNIYENTIIYSTIIVYEDNTTKRMNVIESYPYNYSISFDDFFGYKDFDKYVNKNGITFNIGGVYYGENKSKYQIAITNTRNNRVSIDLSNEKMVYLRLENGERYNLSNAVVTSDFENISKGTTINKNFEFNIPFSIQSKISQLVFRDVKIDGEIHNIEIDL